MHKDNTMTPRAFDISHTALDEQNRRPLSLLSQESCAESGQTENDKTPASTPVVPFDLECLKMAKALMGGSRSTPNDQNDVSRDTPLQDQGRISFSSTSTSSTSTQLHFDSTKPKTPQHCFDMPDDIVRGSVRSLLTEDDTSFFGDKSLKSPPESCAMSLGCESHCDDSSKSSASVSLGERRDVAKPLHLVLDSIKRTSSSGGLVASLSDIHCHESKPAATSSSSAEDMDDYLPTESSDILPRNNKNCHRSRSMDCILSDTENISAHRPFSNSDWSAVVDTLTTNVQETKQSSACQSEQNLEQFSPDIATLMPDPSPWRPCGEGLGSTLKTRTTDYHTAPVDNLFGRRDRQDVTNLLKEEPRGTDSFGATPFQKKTETTDCHTAPVNPFGRDWRDITESFKGDDAPPKAPFDFNTKTSAPSFQAVPNSKPTAIQHCLEMAQSLHKMNPSELMESGSAGSSFSPLLMGKSKDIGFKPFSVNSESKQQQPERKFNDGKFAFKSLFTQDAKDEAATLSPTIQDLKNKESTKEQTFSLSSIGKEKLSLTKTKRVQFGSVKIKLIDSTAAATPDNTKKANNSPVTLGGINLGIKSSSMFPAKTDMSVNEYEFRRQVAKHHKAANGIHKKKLKPSRVQRVQKRMRMKKHMKLIKNIVRKVQQEISQEKAKSTETYTS